MSCRLRHGTARASAPARRPHAPQRQSPKTVKQPWSLWSASFHSSPTFAESTARGKRESISGNPTLPPGPSRLRARVPAASASKEQHGRWRKGRSARTIPGARTHARREPFCRSVAGVIPDSAGTTATRPAAPSAYPSQR